jgi:hypothetical protein
MRVEVVVGVWMGGGDVDRHNCAPVEWCVDDSVSSAAECTESKKPRGRKVDHVCVSEGLPSAGRNGFPSLSSIDNRHGLVAT